MQYLPGKKMKIMALKKTLKPYFRQKLLAMGVVPGAVFQIIRIAPMGDPVHIVIHGINVSLRKQDLDQLDILECVE